MTATKLSIYNGALLFIGERKISALTDEIESRRLLDDVWDRDGVNNCLEQGQWNFAMRGAKLEYSPSITPAFGYTRAFEKPSDMLKLAALCSDEFFVAPLLDYSDEAGFWFCELDEIYIKYVSSDSSYGNDYSLWPNSFTRYVEAYFGSQIVWKLTQNSTKEEAKKKEANKLLVQARSDDAMDSPTQFLPPGRWRQARSNWSGRRDRGNRGSLLG